MGSKLFSAGLGLITLAFSMPVWAENLTHLSQLLSTKQCESCDLSGSGLATANLTGAKLRGANLINANLSQANLSNADLRDADLTGASFYGANLIGANLSGAKLNNTDLRNSYLHSADLTNTNLNNSYLQGATGIPSYAGNAQMFFQWATAEAKRGNYQGALETYNKALSIDSKFAPAYLGRALVYFRLGNNTNANQDALLAGQLYKDQKDDSGYQASVQFIQAMEMASKKPEQKDQSEGDFLGLVQGIVTIGLRFLMP